MVLTPLIFVSDPLACVICRGQYRGILPAFNVIKCFVVWGRTLRVLAYMEKYLIKKTRKHRQPFRFRSGQKRPASRNQQGKNNRGRQTVETGTTVGAYTAIEQNDLQGWQVHHFTALAAQHFLAHNEKMNPITLVHRFVRTVNHQGVA